MCSGKLLSVIGILVWSAVALTASPRALPHRHTVTVSGQDESPAAGCSDLHIMFDGREAVLRSEERTISKAEASNGTGWNGPGLEARAQNGPVTVNVPPGYQSGVVVESDGHGPFHCHASVCSEGRKTWEDDIKRIEFGSGPAVIRVSTVNGPVSVD